MQMFNGFEQILMHVIEETLHTNDLDRSGKKPYKSKEERFDDAMAAIFGKKYERRYKKTADFYASELMEIKNLEKRGMSRRQAVAEVGHYMLPEIKEGNSADKREYEAKLTTLENQVKKHFGREKHHYDEFVPMEGKIPNEASSEATKEIFEIEKRQRENIFQALRAAGWSIYK